MEQIYKRLQNGETSESIAAEFTAALNEAMARFAKEEAEAEAQRLAEEARMKAYAEQRAKEEAKRNDLTEIINSTLGFCAKWYPELGLTDGDWDDADIKPLADMIMMLLDVEVMKGVSKSKKVVEEKTETPRKVRVGFSTGKPLTTDDVFADFFKSLGLN